jgi:ABC-type dipeptide/oligopeptide/nickel transport system ATPase subunit
MIVENLDYHYPRTGFRHLLGLDRSREDDRILRDMSFRLEGQRVGIVGESGCGKSTLIRALVGLLPGMAMDRVHYGDQTLGAWLTRSPQEFRRQVQLIFQHPDTFLNPRLPALDMMVEGLELRLGRTVHASEFLNHPDVHRWMDVLGLTKDHLYKTSSMLSGGECKRLGILRTMLVEPTLVIGDEPFAGVDLSFRNRILGAFQAEQERRPGLRFLIVTHELDVVHRFCDQAHVMYKGEIVDRFPIRGISYAQRHPYTRALFLSHFAVRRPSLRQCPELTSLWRDVVEAAKVDSQCAFRSRCADAREICQQQPPGHGFPRCHVRGSEYGRTHEL